MVGLHGEDCYKEEKLLIKPTSDTIKKKNTSLSKYYCTSINTSMKNILTNLKQHDQTMYESMNHVRNILNVRQSLSSPTRRIIVLR